MEARKGKFPKEENNMSKYILKYMGGSDLELGCGSGVGDKGGNTSCRSLDSRLRDSDSILCVHGYSLKFFEDN